MQYPTLPNPPALRGGKIRHLSATLSPNPSLAILGERGAQKVIHSFAFFFTLQFFLKFFIL